MNRSSTADAAVVREGAPGASVRRRPAVRYGAPALAAALITTASGQAFAQGVPPDPAPDRAWGGCELSDDAVSEIQYSIFESSGGESGPFGDFPSEVQVAFVVVYSLQENNGQALDGGSGGFTGPILCAGGEFGEATLFPFGVETTTEDSPIPDPSSGADSVNILDADEALVLRYEPNFDGIEPVTGSPEERFCHTVEGNTDCFTVFEPE